MYKYSTKMPTIQSINLEEFQLLANQLQEKQKLINRIHKSCSLYQQLGDPPCRGRGAQYYLHNF